MAQYITLNGTIFGNGHDDNPTYAISLPANNPQGGIPQAGIAVDINENGTYDHAATGITKAELDAGINVRFTDDLITSSIITVEAGFQCSGQTTIATWTDTYEPGAARGEVEAQVTNNDAIGNSEITYQFSITLDGYEARQFTVTGVGPTGTTTSAVRKLSRDETTTVDGTGTYGITRISDSSGNDTTADGDYTLTISAAVGSATFSNPTTNGIAGGATTLSGTISGWSKDDEILIEVSEGSA